MKLIVLVNSRSDRDAGSRVQTVEAEDYDSAYSKVQDMLTEDDRLLSVRIDRDDESADGDLYP